jgi:hypothetical protein
MASETTYVLVELTKDGCGCWDVRRVARRPSIGELIPLKRDLDFTITIEGLGDSVHCDIWEEALAFGEGHYR